MQSRFSLFLMILMLFVLSSPPGVGSKTAKTYKNLRKTEKAAHKPERRSEIYKRRVS